MCVGTVTSLLKKKKNLNHIHLSSLIFTIKDKILNYFIFCLYYMHLNLCILILNKFG